MNPWVGRAGHLVALLAIALVVLYLFGDLLDRTAFVSHEQLYIYIRAYEVAKELVAGHFPQAFPDAVYGAGFAFPRFYPPFSLWLSAGMSLLVGDTALGVNLTFFLSVLTSGFAMYWAMVSILRDRWIALAAAIIYVSFPYRFVDVFARGALAECWTFVWYPIITAGLWHAAARRVFKWYLPVGIAGLAVTHNITAVYFLVFCAAFCAIALKWHGWRAVVLPAAAIAIGLVLAAWFLLPQQYYMHGVWVSDPAFMWADAAHVQAHRVMPWQFFYSFERFWLGESHPPQWRDEMSFELGLGHLAMLLVVLLAIRRRKRAPRGDIERRLRTLGRASLITWLVAVLFMMWPSAFLALLPHQFDYIQFPWRLLSVAAFAAALALATYARRARGGRTWRIGLLCASAAIVLLVPQFERQKLTDPAWTDSAVLDSAFVREKGALGFTVLGEYLPRDFDIRGIRNDTLDLTLFEAPEVVDGQGASIESWSRNGLDMDLVVSSPAESHIRLPLVYYDFYRVLNDRGTRLETYSTNGFLTVRVPAGARHLFVRQAVTPIYWVGIAVSLLAAIATAVGAILFRRPNGALSSNQRRG